MPLKAGTRLGPYEVLASLGAGGMGEVYRARDSRLRREVAIKVLPEDLASDPDRLARFEREARAASALADPHIVPVFDVGREGNTPYFACELVEGGDLRRLLGRGPLPLRRALELSAQIASGLAAAHGKGIVHRDLKPENVLLTRSGEAKIADFGLAKVIRTEEASGSAMETASLRRTSAGTILGTVAYMSPEQARGEAVDFRSDQFSFGVILYEMLTGKSPFARATAVETLSAILRDEPEPASDARPDVPPPVRWILERCLAKAPPERYGSTDDLRRDLASLPERLSQVSGEAAAARPPRLRRRRAVLAAAAGIAAGFAIAALLGRVSGRSNSAPGPVGVRRLTDAVGLEESPALSPDGRSVAYEATVGGYRQLFVRLVAGGSPLQVTNDPVDHRDSRWSPDSSSLLYYSPAAEPQSPGTLWEVAALGGAPRRLADAVSGAEASHDGARLAFFRLKDRVPQLVVASRDGSSPRVLASLDPEVYYSRPRWSPDDATIAFQAGQGFDFQVFTIPAGGGKPRPVTPEKTLIRGFAWLPDGSGILFSSSRGSTMVYLPTFNLWRVSRDGTGLRQLTFGETSYVEPDAGRAGLVVASRMRMRFDLWKFPVSGTARENTRAGVAITRQTGVVLTPSLSPDDRQVVYLSDSGGHSNLWILDIASGRVRQITFETDPGVSIGVPNWSPDGGTIVYIRAVPGRADEWRVDPDGSHSRLFAPDGTWASWSPDGRWLYYMSAAPPRLVKIASAGGSPVTVRTDGAEAPSLAPDGRTLYFVREPTDVSGGEGYEFRAASPETAASRLLARIPRRRVPGWQLLHPSLSPDGRWLAMPLTDGVTTNLWAMSTSDGALRALTDFGGRATFIARRLSWSHDGKFLVTSLGEGDADVVALDGLLR